MRGLPLVLTVAFVFASSALLVGPASAQQSSPPSEPDSMPPDPQEQPATDATIQGRVTDGAGRPVAGATVSSYNYGPVSYREDGAEPAKEPAYYGGNSTVTDADGRFRLGVYSGENQLSVHRDGYSQRSVSVPVAAGQTVTQDVGVERFPDKTARIAGKVTDLRSGDGLSFASVSVSNPWYGTWECSLSEAGQSGGSGGGSEPRPAGDAAGASIVAPDYARSCAITVHGDGSFEGLVTPGYSIVSIHAYAPCDGDGASSDSCGPQYFGFSRTLSLPANQTTTVNAALRSQEAPDALVSGYLVDAETGQAIPGGQISFGNQESYGWGYAATDEDGSYRLRLRSGYHAVSVWAPGHLPWEGVLDVRAGESDFDVRLTPGEPAYGGGCCYAYSSKGGVAMAEDAAVAPPAPNGAAGFADRSASDGDDSAETSQQVLYQDLNGGLGPYDPEERADADDGSGELEESGGNGIPGAGLLLTLGAVALAGMAVLRRRA